MLKEFTEHMNRDVIYWNVEMCKKEISKYNSFKEFYKNSKKCYYYIHKHKLLYLLDDINYVKYKKKY